MICLILGIISLLCSLYYFLYTTIHIFNGITIMLFLYDLKLYEIFILSLVYIHSFIILIYYININYNKKCNNYKNYRNRIKYYGKQLFHTSFEYRNNNLMHIYNDNILIGLRILYMILIPYVFSIYSTEKPLIQTIIILSLFYLLIHTLIIRGIYEYNIFINYFNLKSKKEINKNE